MPTQPAAKAPKSGSRPTRPSIHTARRRLWADRAATWAVTGGGMAIIAGILGILLFIVIEIAPVLSGADLSSRSRLDTDGPPVLAALTDAHRSHAALLTADGLVRVVGFESGQEVARRQIVDADGAPLRIAAAAPVPGRQLLAAASDDGRIVVVPVGWEISFEGSRRVVRPELGEPVAFEMDPAGGSLGAFAARLDDDGRGTAAAQLADGTIAIVRREVTVNFLTDEHDEQWTRDEIPAAETLTVMLLDDDAGNLYAGSARGPLLWWRLGDGPVGSVVVESVDSPVTALTLLIGDQSLVVGRENGGVAVWFPVRQSDESFVLQRIREFPPHPAAVRLLAPSLRDKGFLAHDASGGLALYYSTSHRVMWRGPSPVPDATAMFFSPKGDGALLAGDGRIELLDIRNPHPEISLRALFGKVWYEGYERPDYVWQSTGGTDDFEPKLSLTPLLFGTLKGTIYSLFLAIPLGVFGAMYTSQFVHHDLRRYIKPTVETMAALPSVVLGFLAGLWLAPRVERVLPALAMCMIVAPLSVVLAGYAWRMLPQSIRGRFASGFEALIHMAVLAAAIGLCLWIGPRVESAIFAGDIQAWLLDATGLRYDQRNAVVVGLAMGFAVIPIIFSIAEDAFSNVPPNLVSGSLALGANRWQTVTRVVLPTASPGIFSAVLIGFGRAIGETMIVLMATGNTPIMEWNPFNGFRTLSANIAVEIPEAPHGATLYRTLFLAALLLFLFTFFVNTVGDVVRQRLRKRYADL